MKNLIYIIAFLLLTNITLAQQPSDWSAQSDLTTIGGVDVEVTSNLSLADDIITWEQVGYNSSDTTNFNVTSSTGSWDAQSHLGQLSYEMTLEDSTITASLTLSGSDQGITATLSFGEGDSTQSYVMHIDTDTLTNL